MQINRDKTKSTFHVERIGTKNVYDGKIFSVRIEKSRLPSGDVVSKEIVVFPKCVAIIALPSKNKVVLVEEFRYPAGQVLLEIPAGKVRANEKPAQAAQRELEEETGYKASKIEEILRFYMSPGYSTEFMHLFLATNLKHVGQRLEKGELIKVKIVDLDEIAEMITNGRIVDAKTIIGIQTYLKLYPTDKSYGGLIK